MSKVWAILKKENGQIANKKVIRFLFEQLKDGRYQVEVFPHDKRTNPMNRYLHGILIPEFRKGLNDVGYDEVRNDDEAKEIMKAMFLKTRVVNKETGEIIEYTKRTRDLTKLEMSSLFDDVIKFSAEHLGRYIAYPSEQTMIDYE